MQEMPIGQGVSLHNIMGVSHHPSSHEPSDGIVPLSSAEHPDCASELIIEAVHAEVHRSRETTRETVRILVEHLSTAEPLRDPTPNAGWLQQGAAVP
jgi:hypothetical protein